MERFEGWILDLRGTPGGVEVWVKTLEGGVNRFTYPLRPSFFVYREGMNSSRLAGILERKGGRVSVVEGVDFFSGDPVETLRVTAPSPAAFPFIRKCAGRAAGEEHLFSCDLPVEQIFFYETGTFPLCRCLYEMREGGEIGAILPLEEAWEREYELPHLSVLHLAPVPPRGANPFQAPWAALELSCEGEAFEVEWSPDGAFLENVNAVVRSFDPELIISEWGDEYVFPRLFELSGKTGIPLAFDRSEGTGKRGAPSRKGRSFFSYGQIIYRAPTVSFPGRVHLDGRNSFFYGEVGLEGIIELSRISRIPLGRVARASPGTIISAMEMEYAWKRNILIPFKKRHSEAFKRADQLVVSDKGGLVYMPPPGTFENVCELDFASMYPTLMVEYNISPETLLCSCCGERKVPETGTHTCVKRRGLIPSVLEPVVERRRWYKRMREGSTGKERRTYNARQTALKWILVVSFGFLGYRNARFGKIEAHEAVTAYGREMLLAAKEVAEEEGYTFLHGLTDALWIRKEGASSGDYQRLAERISTVTGMEIVVEGVYRWITFLPSKTRDGPAVPGWIGAGGGSRCGQCTTAGTWRSARSGPIRPKTAATPPGRKPPTAGSTW